MKKVLIITYYWPPAGGSGVQRWVKFSKYLPSYGWQPIVYTPENPQISTIDKTLIKEISPQTKIIKQPIFEPYGIYSSLMGKKASTDIKKFTSASNSSQAPQDQRSSWLKKAILYIRGNFFIPDPRCFWVRPSVKFLKKYLEKNPVDVIITTGPPHSMHLIGKKLSAETGIPWISDFRDPWTGMYYYKNMLLSKRSDCKHHKLEQEVFDASNEILTVTPMMAEDIRKVTKTPVRVITNGYDEEDFEQIAVDDGYFNIAHTGLFAPDGNPEVLWKVLGEKCASDAEFRRMLRLRFVGDVDNVILQSIQEAGLSENLLNLGYKPHTVAVREQICASLLILPLRRDKDYKCILPGKLFEYLAARHPILGIGQTDGAMANVVKESNAGKVFLWDDARGIREYIDDAWMKFKADKLVSESKDIERFSRRNLTKQLAEMLNNVSITR